MYQGDGQYQSSVNATGRGRGGNNRNRGGNNRGRINGRGGEQGQSRGNPSPGSGPPKQGGQTSRPRCQICKKVGHEANRCWYRYDDDEQTNTKTAAAAGHGADTNWYVDTGASDHITSELENLTVRDKYNGRDQVHTASGAGMKISNIGHTILHTPQKDLHLKNILHVPSADKNLVSVHKLAKDNNAFLEFYPYSFSIKDQATRKILHQGRCKGGLYPIGSRSAGAAVSSQVFLANKPSTSRWHDRLGHPAFSIVERILHSNNLPFHSDNKTPASICDSCQMAKSHQLPYSSSHEISKSPLDLIYSDVWGPAPESVGRNKYYVSFIDDHSKYTWIYLLRHKSDVFRFFHDFKNLVEHKFDRKIISVQSDWGGEYEKLNSFFQCLGISHRVSCPHAHQQNGAAERKHRHIVDVGLALLANASMPLKYWDQAFLTATYLINILPSKVIDY
jgi:histone deacetylase 1/2